MAAWTVHIVCVLIVGVQIYVSRTEDVKRTDPGSDITVTWTIDQPARLEYYDVINVTVNDSDVLLSCHPAVQNCEDGGATNSLRLVFVTAAVDVSNASVSEVDGANGTSYDNSSDRSQAFVVQVGFELKNVQITDAGRYSLSLATDDGQLTEHKLVLYVYLPPTRPIVTGPLVELNAGQKADLVCNGSLIQSVPVAYRNSSLLVYKWYRDDELIADDQKQLSLVNLSKADNKVNYSCSVREGNSSNPVNSGQLTLNVIYIDEVRLHADVNTSEVVCTSDCNPECSYRWLDGAGKVLSNVSSLPLSADISGRWVRCEASNKVGIKSQSSFVFYTEIAFTLVEQILCGLIAIAFCVVLSGAVVLRKQRLRQRNQRAEPCKSNPQPSSDALDRYRRHAQQQKHSDQSRQTIQPPDVPLPPAHSGSTIPELAAKPPPPHTPRVYVNVAKSVSGRHAHQLKRSETELAPKIRRETIDFEPYDDTSL